MRILIKTVAGSHLFGTNTPQSDKDYKGVYLPDAAQILLGDYKDTEVYTTGNEHEKNSKEDIDVELYSLKKFMKMVKSGDTAALELLFTPEEFILEKDPLWDIILENRDKLLSSKVNAMIGYARQQANKYGIKGSRMGELSTIIEILKKHQKSLDFKNAKLKHAWEGLTADLKELDHVHVISLMANKNMENVQVPGLDILGKRFDYHCGFIYVLEILKKIYKNYGHRAREAKKNNGIDWKALSHATRVSLQGLELLSEHKITLPLPEENRELVMRIKKGEVDYKVVSKKLEDLLEQLEEAKINSTLPEEVDCLTLNSMIINFHKEVIDASEFITL